MKAEWPQMLYRKDGSRRVFASPDAVPEGEGWLTVEVLRKVDHDGDLKMGGGPIRPVSDEHVHVPADYEVCQPVVVGRKRRKRR